MTLKSSLKNMEKTFQIKVLISSLLTHKEFLINIYDIINDEDFHKSSSSLDCKRNYKIYNKYHTTPSLDILKVEVKKS